MSRTPFSPWSRRGPLLALLALLLAAPRLLAQGWGANDRPGEAVLREGTHVFRRMLHDNNFTALKDFQGLRGGTSPGEVVVIVLGDLRCLRQLPGRLSGFVRDGGSVLLASDRALDDLWQDGVRRELLDTAGVTIDGQTVVSLDLEGYQGHNFCPLLVPIPGAQPDLFSSAQADVPGPLTVATNVPSFLRSWGPLPRGVRPLANLPPLCAVEVRTRFHVERGNPFHDRLLFAVGGEVGKGRILVLADHSIFINQMMLPEDNNNVEFTQNCLTYLSENGRRKRVLFVEDGTPSSELNLPLKNPNLPVGELLKQLWQRRRQVAVEVDRAVARAEANNAHNHWLLDALARRRVHPPDLARIALVVGALLLLLYGVYRVGARGRYQHDTAVPLVAQAVGAGLPGATLQEQRHQALLRAGNLYDSARQVARQWFRSAGVPDGRAPRVAAQGGWWRARRLRRSVERLWALAHGPAPLPVSARAYRRLLAELEELDEELASGSIVIGEQ
jgi:hypothetical protein